MPNEIRRYVTKLFTAINLIVLSWNCYFNFHGHW